MKKSVKSILAVLLAAAMMISVSACKKSDDSDEKEKTAAENTEEEAVEEKEEEVNQEDQKDKKDGQVKMATKRTAETGFAESVEDFDSKLGKLIDLSKYDRNDDSDDRVYYKIFKDQRVKALEKDIYLEDGTHIVLPVSYAELKEQGWSSDDEDKMIENKERGWFNTLEGLKNRYSKRIYLLADNRDKEDEEVKLSESDFAVLALFPYENKSVKKGDEYKTAFTESERSPAFIICGGLNQYSGIEDVISALGDPTKVEIILKNNQIKLEYNNIPEWDNETVMFEFGTYSESSETTELSNNCIGRVEIGK